MLPFVAVAVPFVDLLCLPVLLLLIASTAASTVRLLLPALLLVQFAFTAGVASAPRRTCSCATSRTSSRWALLFYLTPVFYGLNVPEQFHWLLRLNPLTAFVEPTARSCSTASPAARADLGVVPSAASALAGWLVFRRLEPRFVDEL